MIPTFAIQHLAVGDKVNVLYRDRNYSSVVQDMPAPDQIVIAQPTNMGIYLNLDEGEEAEIFFKKENGILTFLVTQEARFMSGPVPMLRLRAASEVRRSQRRSYYRLEKSLPVQLCVKEETTTTTDSCGLTIKARTINISGGGCRIAIKQPVDNNAMLECKITLAPDLDLKLDGQVVWVERLTGSERTNIIGVQFVDEDTSTQKALVSYVTNEQRKQLKNK